jgi:hypothetical protein
MFGVGLRFGAAFLLDTAGNPVCTGAIGSGSVAATTGYAFSGEKAFDVTVPEPRKITFVGEDRVMSVDFLPAIDGVSGSLNTAALDQALNAMLTGVTNATVGESKALPYATDMQGSEPDVSLLLYQQAQDRTTKQRRWRVLSLSLAKCIPLPPGMGDNPAEMRYSIAVTPSTKTIWGETLTSGSYGCTEASLIEQMCEGKPQLDAFQGSAANPTVLTLSQTPKSAAKLAVYKNGAKLASPGAYSLAAKEITLVAGIGAADYVLVFYEV